MRQRRANRESDFDRLIDAYLENIQAELSPEQASMVVAIHIESGQYVLGNDHAEASAAYKKRWPEGGFYICRVDGTPAMRM